MERFDRKDGRDGSRSMNKNSLLPYGLGNPELVEIQKGYFVDAAIVGDLNKLIDAAREAGFELRLAYNPKYLFPRYKEKWLKCRYPCPR